MNYVDYVKPAVGTILQKLKLDKKYVSAKEGNLFYINEQGKTIEVRDFVGGYGSLVLGHNCKPLVDYARQLLDDNIPVHDQLSIKKYTGLLAKSISDEIGQFTGKEYISTFTNSGAETVEAAIKHARLKKLKELNGIIDQVHKNLNAISNLMVKENIPVLTFNGRSYVSFKEFKEEVLAANQAITDQITPVLLASEMSYHGKTISALKATYNDKYKTAFLFKSDKKETVFFSWDENDVRNKLTAGITSLYMPEITGTQQIVVRKWSYNICIGVIIEPILGEGGVIVVPPDFLKKLQELCVSFKVPFILDEIQTGMYRTGAFLNSLKSGIHADYYLIGKALGGGLVKIGALVIDNARYEEEFGLLHSSTFAEDEYSSAIALRALDIMKQKSGKIDGVSKSLFGKLHALQTLYPDIIENVHGEGLMIGVTFRSYHDSACYPLQFASRSSYFNYLVASYLLNNFQVRVAPTLSSSFTIRIQPNIDVTDEATSALTNAIKELCEVLKAEDFYKFIECMLPKEHQKLRSLEHFSNGTISTCSTKNITRVGFLMHFISEETVLIGDPSLAVLSKEAIAEFLTSIFDIGTGVIAGCRVIKDVNGKEVEIIFAGLPFTSGMVRQALVNDEIEPYRKICHKAVNMLVKDFGVHVVGLGQYTSIITSNGTTIPYSNVHITTGNSFTVYIGLQSVLNEIHKGDIIRNPANITTAILGAAGNISSVYAKCCSQFVSQIFLKGSDRPDGIKRIERSARELVKYIFRKLLNQKQVATSQIEERLKNSNTFKSIVANELDLDNVNLYTILQNELGEQNPVQVFADLEVLKKCNLVIVATNQPTPFLSEEHLSENTIVYDISVPLNVTEDLFNNTKNIKVIIGGVVSLPNAEALPLKGYPLDPGTAYACISETLLLGLEKFEGNFSYGNITPDLVYKIGGIANDHKFLFHREKLKSAF